MLPPSIRALIIDMDGVLWKGDAPIGDLPAIFARLRERGLKAVFATNNGTRTPGQYVERLRGFGVQAEAWQVVTSALGVAYLLEKHFKPGHPASPLPPGNGGTEAVKVFAIGEAGVMDALREKGFELLDVAQAEAARAVVMSMDRQINFEKMREAALLVRRGLPFYATNPDKTFPTPRGEIPGAGAWISVVVTAAGVEPIYAGKPAPYLIDLARERLGTAKEETLVVGDRLETDIAGGQAAGCPCALVLSGVSTLEQAQAWRPKIDVLAQDLRQLIE